MEKEEREKKSPRSNKKVSLFRRRKKPPERQLVRVKNQKSYKRLLINILLVVIILFIIATLLYIVRTIFLPGISQNQKVMLLPQGNSFPDNNQIRNVIQNSGLEISRINFASNSSTISFYFKKKTQVMFSAKKDIRNQLDLIEAISNELLSEGKQAIYIDLRYNKPIVRIQ